MWFWVGFGFGLIHVQNDEDAEDRIIAAGWLTKKGRKVRNWKKRWFVLQGRYLRYYKSENTKISEKLGEINLETCVVEELKHREESLRVCIGASKSSLVSM
jgi:hypothetical protein